MHVLFCLYSIILYSFIFLFSFFPSIFIFHHILCFLVLLKSFFKSFSSVFILSYRFLCISRSLVPVNFPSPFPSHSVITSALLLSTTLSLHSSPLPEFTTLQSEHCSHSAIYCPLLSLHPLPLPTSTFSHVALNKDINQVNGCWIPYPSPLSSTSPSSNSYFTFRIVPSKRPK